VADRSAPWTQDEVIVAADMVCGNDWRDLRRDDPRVLALSRLLRSLPGNAAAAEDPAFRSAGSVSRKAADIATAHPDYPGASTKGGVTTRQVVESFVRDPAAMSRIAAVIRAQWEEAVATGRDPLDLGRDPDAPENGDAGVAEGGVVLAMHLRRERDRGLRERKIRAVLQAHGALSCEVCGFDFGRTYGDVGAGYIEVHHVVPLHASGQTTTRLADLAVVCSNCHRMIHRRTPWLTPSELRVRVRRTG